MSNNKFRAIIALIVLLVFIGIVIAITEKFITNKSLPSKTLGFCLIGLLIAGITAFDEIIGIIAAVLAVGVIYFSLKN